MVDLAGLLNAVASDAAGLPPVITHLISTPATRIRRGPEVRLVLANPGDADDGQPDPALVGLIVRAHVAKQAVLASPGCTIGNVAAGQGMTLGYFTLLLRLSTLAPDIVTAILAGRQPASLNRQKLARITNLPPAWDQQRTMLGFV